MPPRKLKEKRKAPTPKMVKEVPQESAAVLWLMERTGFDKNELVCVPLPCVHGIVAAREGVGRAVRLRCIHSRPRKPRLCVATPYAHAPAARVLATGGCTVGADGTLQEDRRGQEDRGQGEEEEGGRQR